MLATGGSAFDELNSPGSDSGVVMADRAAGNGDVPTVFVDANYVGRLEECKVVANSA